MKADEEKGSNYFPEKAAVFNFDHLPQLKWSYYMASGGEEIVTNIKREF